MNKGICTFVLHSPRWINESHASGAKSSLSFLKGFDFWIFIPITVFLLTRQWNIQHNIGQNYFYWREMTNVDPDVVLVFQRVKYFMEKKNEGKKPFSFHWKWNIAILWFFISFKLELVEVSRVVLGTFSNFLVLFFRSILSFLKHQSGDKELVFWGKNRKYYLFSFLCFFLSSLLPAVLFFSPSPVRLRNHHIHST